MLTNEELKVCLAELSLVKKAFRQNDFNEAWNRLRELELKLGRGLRDGNKPQNPG